MPRLSAFVGRSFLEPDKSIWHELRDILDSLKSLGFEYEDAKEAQIRPISEKVRELIMRHEIYIGVLTKRDPIWQAPSSFRDHWLRPLGSYVPRKWTTSEWVIEEIGFAIGRDRKVLLLIENDVNFPTSDLDGDTQWVPFNRRNLSASQTEISQMILGLISQRVTSITEPVSIATVAPSEPGKVTELEEPSFRDQLVTIKKYILNGNLTEAEELQQKILGTKTDTTLRKFYDSLLLGYRASNGDTGALTRLKQKCADDPSDFDAIEALADVFSSFDQFNQATQLLISLLDKVSNDKRGSLTVKASEALCDDSKATEAISLLLKCLQMENHESEHIPLYRELARAAGKAGLTDLEAAFLEKVLTLVPSDNDARFRLAFVYSADDLELLAAHHYALVVHHTNLSAAYNNLGVTYGKLGFKANQFKLYREVADRHALAKSNLAELYLSAGALPDAEILANAATSTPSNQTHAVLGIERGRYVLKEISAKRKTENDAIARITEDTKSQRMFMCAYAEAYCAPSLPADSGIFTTTHGDITIVRTQVDLKGEGTFTKTTHPGGLRSIMAPTVSGISTAPVVITYSLLLSAKLHGQSGTFELKISPSNAPLSILGDSTRIIKGLMYFQDGGNVIQFLEREEKKGTVASARRKP